MISIRELCKRAIQPMISQSQPHQAEDSVFLLYHPSRYCLKGIIVNASVLWQCP